MKNKAHKNITKLHKEKLGLDIPENFFKSSKDSILNAVSDKKQQTVFTLKPIISYAVAASIILLLGFGYWLQKNGTPLNPDIENTEEISSLFLNSEDFLLSSLMIDDNNMDDFMDDFIVNNIIVEAELEEQALENIFINSIFIEDSIINTYLEESLIENVVL